MDLFDENKAIEAINNALSEAGRATYSDDELLNVIDMIWDYYEENGLLDIDDDFEADEDENIAAELSDYICRMLKKDKEAKIRFEDVPFIVEAELAYEDNLLSEL